MSDEKFEQFDFLGSEFLDERKDSLARLIGTFLIEFSLLEHELNRAVAAMIHQDNDTWGYFVILRLSTRDKIELLGRFAKIFARHNINPKLSPVVKLLSSENEFRNIIVHANWGSLSEDYRVRYRMQTDPDDGEITFKRAHISPTVIKEHTKSIRKLTRKLINLEELGA